MGVQWRQATRAIGVLLNQLQEAGEPADLYRAHIMRDEFGMSMAQSAVAMKWAAGEFGSDEDAEVLVAKVKASELQHMAPEVAQSLLNKKQTIQSPTEKRVVNKTLREMDRDEAHKNIRAIGVEPFHKTDRPYRSCVASHVICEDGGTFIVVRGPMPIRVKLTRKVIAELLESEAVPA